MYGTPMKHILIVLFVMLVPYRMLAQGGVLTSDDYDEEVRRAEQFQFSEEYASLMIMPLEAYPDAFSALSDFNFSFVRYNRRGYDYRYRNFSIDGVSLYDPMTGNQQWNLMGAIYNSYGPVESETGLAPGSWSLGGLGDTRAYSRMAGTVPKRISVGMMFTDRRFRGGVRAGISSGWMKGGWAIAGAGISIFVASIWMIGPCMLLSPKSWERNIYFQPHFYWHHQIVEYGAPQLKRLLS